MKKPLVVLALLATFAPLSHALAADYYVRPAGATYGTGSGTSYANAWSGLSSVNWTTVDNGNGTLWVDGAHNESMTVGQSGESGAPIVVKAYSSGASVKGVTIGSKSYVTLDGLAIRNGSGHGISFNNVVTDMVVRNCTIESMARSGITSWDTTHQSSVLVENSIIRNNGTDSSLHYNGIYYMGGSITIRGCTISNNGQAGGSEEGKSHGIYLGEFQGGGGVQSAEIYNNTISGNMHGCGIRLKSGANVYNNKIFGNKDGGVVLANDTKASTLDVYGNLFYGNEDHGVGMYTVSSGGTVNIHNNSFYKNGTGGANSWFGEIYIASNIGTLRINNNILYASSDDYVITAPAAQSNMRSDYNVFYGSSGSPINYGGSGRAWSYWTGTLGQDAHGVFADPKYVSPPSNMTLQTGSPAISLNAGAGGSGGTTTPTNPPPTALVPLPPEILGIY